MMRLRSLLLFSLLLCLDCSGGFCASSKIQIQLELRHEGFTGRSRPVQGFRKRERLKDLKKAVGKLCGECQVKNKAGDYRIIFTVNHRPWGELSELLWEVRDRDNNEVGRGWSYVTHRSVSDALAALRQHRVSRQSPPGA